MRTMHYVIDGDPTPLAAVRVNYNTKRMYDGQSQLKLLTSITLRQQHDEAPLFKGPLILDITFFMPIPETFSPNKRIAMVNKLYTLKPNCEDMQRYILDCAKKICFAENSVIAVMHAKKIYSLEPRIEFSLQEASQ